MKHIVHDRSYLTHRYSFSTTDNENARTLRLNRNIVSNPFSAAGFEGLQVRRVSDLIRQMTPDFGTPKEEASPGQG